jgi:hypothetical protein
MNLYLNDPMAKHKIDYMLNKNDEKLKKSKVLAATVNAHNNSKAKDTTFLHDPIN